MQTRFEVRRDGEVIVVVMCKPAVSDGDLATMLEDIEQELRWNVMSQVEVTPR